jgi:SAM-dependent methyltransferase
LKAYTTTVYGFVGETSRASARRIVPLVTRWLQPRSVVDFGCGTGEWLAAFREAGASRVLGLDGDWVPRDKLAIAPDEFRPADLRQPIELPDAFDLALCLEVMGHVLPPFDETLLDSLARVAPALLFSAPIPLQGGIGGNATNRAWPADWAARLARRGFPPIDCVRGEIWDDPQVAWWFAQNTFVAVRSQRLAELPQLAAMAGRDASLPRALVHPRCYESTVVAAARVGERPLRQLLAAMARAVAHRGRVLLGRPRVRA